MVKEKYPFYTVTKWRVDIRYMFCAILQKIKISGRIHLQQNPEICTSLGLLEKDLKLTTKDQNRSKLKETTNFEDLNHPRYNLSHKKLLST